MSEGVAIVGAGLAGSLAACFLARQGHRVSLYERRGDLRASGAEEGRSINLALSARGIDALERIGLAEAVLEDALPMRGRTMHAVDGELSYQAYSADGRHAINSVSRAGLARTLLDRAEAEPGVSLHFGHRLVALDPETCELTFEVEGDGLVTRQAAAVIGADGAGSAVRAALEERAGAAVVRDVLDYAYKELEIPPAADGGFALDPASLHIWPRGSRMMIALPNPDRTFTCTLFWPRAELEGLAGEQAVLERFARDYPDALALMPTLAGDFAANPVGSLLTVRTWPWSHGRVGLIGDAAHAIVPFYGQGMNAAFEDCVALARAVEDAGADWAAALAAFSAERKDDAEAIADLALANFVEMRDKVGSRAFLLRKRLEHALEDALPAYRSLYELISFTTVPYADARRRARLQGLAVAAAAAGLVVCGLAAATYASRSSRRRRMRSAIGG